jgi:hypothetical protein
MGSSIPSPARVTACSSSEKLRSVTVYGRACAARSPGVATPTQRHQIPLHQRTGGTCTLRAAGTKPRVIGASARLQARLALPSGV